MRRLVLRTLLLSLLAIGVASAARVKHTVDLPTNPLHWQRYLSEDAQIGLGDSALITQI